MVTNNNAVWFAAACGAARWRMLAVGSRILFPVAIIVLGFGCGHSPKAIPESPPDAIQTVVQGLEDNQPRVLWDALPPSYQADIRELIATFCTHMDADIYNRTFRILAKAVNVLEEKEVYIYKSPLALSTPILESIMDTQWDEAIGLLNSIAKSDLSTLASLSQMDPGDFLASTGHQVMEGLDNLRRSSQRSPKPNRWERLSQTLKEARIDFQQSTNGQGFLRFNSATTNAVKEVELRQVEGRWVPLEMAATWKDRIDQAKQRMAKLNSPEFDKAKPMLSMVLDTLDNAMDSLLRAESQKEFDHTLKSLVSVGSMLQSMRNTN